MFQYYDIVDQGEANIGSDGVVTLTDNYLAICSTPRDNLRVLTRGMAGFQRGSLHPTESGLFASTFEARQEPHSGIWRVRVQYTDTPPDESEESPLAKPIGMTTRSTNLSAYTLTDNKGRMMLNTAGDPFEPQERKETVVIYTVTKNLSVYPGWLLTYPNSVNNDAVRIRGLTFPPKTLTLAGVSISDYQYGGKDNKVQYLTAEMELHYRRSTWKTFVPSRGLQEKYLLTREEQGLAAARAKKGEKVSDFGKRRISNNKNQPTTTPYLLDKDGVAIRDPKPESVYILEFMIPDELSYSALPLK